MLQNKKIMMIVALAASICLWAYVNGSVDPTITKKFAAVPIQIINQDSLIQDDLAVDSVSVNTVDLTLEGSRGDLNKLELDDIKVTADMYDRHKGSNSVSIEVEVPKGISVENKSVDKIEVEVDDLYTEQKDVKISVEGKLPENTTLGETIINPEELTVFGTKNNVDKVKRLQAVISADDLSMNSMTIESKVEPVDSNGRTVLFVNTSERDVDIKVTLTKFKEVPLKVKTVGNVSADYEVESIKLPETIEIVGKATDLKNIESVKAEDVDISQVTASTKLEITPILPEGVSVKDDKVPFVEVVIKEPTKKEFKFSGAEIGIENLESGLGHNIEDEITITVSGKGADVQPLTKNEIKVSVDAKGLDAGSYVLKLNVTVNKEGVTAKPSKEEVTLVLREE